MKTNVNMIRKMDDYNVIQRTKDGFFNGNELLVQWNRTNNKRRMDVFLNTAKTKEFISEIISNEPSASNCITDTQAVMVVKGKNTSKGKQPDQVWMHPYLFIDFAMWINPTFKYKVIQFVYDQLINYRNDAGDKYKGLTNSISIFEPNSSQYIKLAKGLNWIVFDKHESGIRQTATQDQLSELIDIQKKLAFSIDMGYIKTFDTLLNEMRRIYHLKYKL